MNKKNHLCLGGIVFLIVCFRFSCFALSIGETFVIFADKYIPLFINEGTKFEYEVGSHGTNCYDLDTVLPPGTFVKVLNEEKNSTVYVFCKVSKSCSFNGFIHAKFFEHSMGNLDSSIFDSMAPPRDIPNLQETCEMLNSYRETKIPYAWGCNNLGEVNLDGLYAFVCKNKNSNDQGNTPYRCVGLDCSGILHRISSWTLPHSTGQLYNFPQGKCLYELDEKTSDDELRMALKSMRDTDFVVCPSAHVIIFLHGGFIEAKGCNYGVVYTDAAHAMKELKDLIKRGTVRVIRWHPKLLSQETSL